MIIWTISLVTPLYQTHCNPMDCSTPGFPVLHQLSEHTQTHVYQVGDAIQPSRPLSSPSTPTFNLSKHCLIIWTISSITPSSLMISNPMEYSTPGFPVLNQLPELTQTHVHRCGDAIQPFHPLSSPSTPTFNLSKHQGLLR